MRIVRKRLAEAVMAGQPAFAVPVYFSVFTDNPPYWLSLTIAVIPIIVRWGVSRRLFTRTAFDVPILIFLVGTLLGLAIAVDKGIAAGALLASVIPGLTGVAFFTRNRNLRTVSGILLAVFLAAMVLSDSGGGWIAAAIGLAFVLFCWHWQTVMVTVPVYGVAAGILTAFYHRLSWIAPSFSTGSLIGRFDIWENTVKLSGGIASITGLGLGRWAKTYQEQYGGQPIHIHNSYLQLYIDSGLIGLAVMIAAAIQFGRISLASLRASRESPWYGVAVGLTGGVIAGAAMAMYDVTTTVTIWSSATSYIYMSVPFIWVWAALVIIANRKLKAIKDL